MKTGDKYPFVVFVLITALGLILAGQVTAQTFTTLHSFTGGDGESPSAGLMFSGNILYGTTVFGGGAGSGTVFRLNIDGTGLTNLYRFTTNSEPSYTNSDGASAYAGLILSSNTLYGTAETGGNSGQGTVFALNTDGTGFTNLHSFTGGSGGGHPYAGLILSSNTLYGTAFDGGYWGYGTVFALSSDGTGFTNLHHFAYDEGTGPVAALMLSSNTLFGTAYNGAGPSAGTVFALNIDGMGFTNLHIFTGDDGSNPNGRLILSGNTLYGTASYGGSFGPGTVFALNTDGTGFTNLHSFAGTDGAFPKAGLILSGSALFGTTWRGGSSGAGTVFSVNTDGTDFTKLYSFTGGGDGAEPNAELVLSGNVLYGTASYNGGSSNGTVFSLSFPPQLSISPSGPNIILTWPTNFAGFDYTGFTLQSTTNLVAPAWTTNPLPPVVVNGQNTVTNPISGTQQFFRLSQ